LSGIILVERRPPPIKTPILILCLISFTLPAQTNLNASPQKLVTAGYAAKSDGVVEIGMVELTGRKINKADSLTKCQGDCEITIHDIIVKADELDFHPDTGEAEARGNVRVKIMPHGAVAQ
jgi:lipopolysaccharide assembly outer membrane protein LptD (OstA)